MTYIYHPFPRRLYLNGEVIEGDLHATNSVVVESAEEEAEARKQGYAKAWEVIEKTIDGGNGGSPKGPSPETTPSARGHSHPDQDSAAAVSADPPIIGLPAIYKSVIADDVDDIESLRKRAEALGVKIDRRWKEARLRDEIEAAQ